MKKAQASLFIALGLLLLIALGSVGYFKHSTSVENKPVIVPINDFVEQCLDSVTDDVVKNVALQGGMVNPNDTIEYHKEQITILSYYIENGYQNVVLDLSKLETDMEGAIEKNIKGCLTFQDFERQGYTITTGMPKVDLTIAKDDVIVKLKYHLTLTRGKDVQNYEVFNADIKRPLGRLLQFTYDILNSEIYGYFDKEEYMLTHDIHIEKHKPYPDTIYSLNINNPNKKTSGLQFNFALKGIDTVGKQALNYKETGCCYNENICVKNPLDCPFEYNETCNCPKADIVDNSQGKNCLSTYNYMKEDYSGPERKHGTSWCSYESVAGKGLDYVGTRHYLHSCIDGVEYIEECRDFREEICVESVENKKGLCRTNRWSDCYAQDNKKDCEDKNIRDCVWAGYLWTEKKCHPEVPPGFKFWERESKDICNIASMNKDSYGDNYPRSWGHSSLLYCQRTGDCGNYRNYADVLTELGYFNRDGEPEPWVYWENGLTSKGDNFVVKSQIYVTPQKNATIPKGSSDGDAVCDEWQAPSSGDCSLCKNKMHPCTEYRCRSLGKNCVFDNGLCKNSIRTDKEASKITLTRIKAGFNFAEQKSPYYGLSEYVITPEVMSHTPFLIEFETSKPTRCSLGLRPPQIAMGTVKLPEVQLNDYQYKTEYQINISFPTSNFTRLNEYLLFIRCNDKSGNKADERILKVSTIDQAIDVLKPMVLKNNGIIYLNEPVICKTSDEDNPYDEMSTICNLHEEDILYDAKYPLGSFACDGAKKFVECRDYSNNSLRFTN